MDFKEIKITDYRDSVSALPDYPSDAGYTAEKLKAVFDSRTDNEIKEKFNALLDELKMRFDDVTLEIFNEIMAHNGDDVAHMELFAKKADAEEIGELIDALENQISAIDLILSGKADWTDLEKKVDKVSGKGLSANDFTDEYVFKVDEALRMSTENFTDILNHTVDFENPHNVTPEQIGAITQEQLDERIGDIDSALDELHAYAVALSGGEA